MITILFFVNPETNHTFFKHQIFQVKYYYIETSTFNHFCTRGNRISFTSFSLPLFFFSLMQAKHCKLSSSKAKKKFPPGYTRQSTFEHTWTAHWAYISTAWFPSHCTITPRLTRMNHLPWAWTVSMTFPFEPTQLNTIFLRNGTQITQRSFPFLELSAKLSQFWRSPTQLWPVHPLPA